MKNSRVLKIRNEEMIDVITLLEVFNLQPRVNQVRTKIVKLIRTKIDKLDKDDVDLWLRR